MRTDPLSLLPSRLLRVKNHVQGCFVYRANDPSTGLYRVRTGRVELRQRGVVKGVSTLHYASAGELFSEDCVASEKHTSTAVCVEDCVLESIQRTAVIAQIANNPMFSMSLFSYMVRKIDHSRQLNSLLRIPSADARVLAAMRFGLLDSTVSDLAQHIGLTREACYRSLTQLVRAGHIEKVGRGKYVPLT